MMRPMPMLKLSVDLQNEEICSEVNSAYVFTKISKNCSLKVVASLRKIKQNHKKCCLLFPVSAEGLSTARTVYKQTTVINT